MKLIIFNNYICIGSFSSMAHRIREKLVLHLLPFFFPNSKLLLSKRRDVES